MDFSKSITGVITCNNKSIVFHGNDHHFCFLDNTIKEFYDEKSQIKLLSDDSFIYGRTHSNEAIAVYLGDSDFVMSNAKYIISPLYILSDNVNYNKENMQYDTIVFEGGTLNSVFYPNALVQSNSDGKRIMEEKYDGFEYDIETKNVNFKFKVYSVVNYKRGLSGSELKNDTVQLIMKFENSQSFNEFISHYNNVKTMLSFMTYRSEVGFNKVTLHDSNDLMNSATVFIKDEYTPSEKEIIHNINFKELNDTIPAFFKILYDTEEKEPSYLFDFIPKNDKELNSYNNMRIRQICSALECELSFVDDINSNQKLNDLIEIVKNDIKNYRTHNDGISNDTYNSIFSSISTWSLTLTERLQALYHKFEKEMRRLERVPFDMRDEDIRKFVQYRNKTTHGVYQVLDMRIATTAHFLCGLIYCCFLCRIGMERDKIEKLCELKLLR